MLKVADAVLRLHFLPAKHRLITKVQRQEQAGVESFLGQYQEISANVLLSRNARVAMYPAATAMRASSGVAPTVG